MSRDDWKMTVIVVLFIALILGPIIGIVIRQTSTAANCLRCGWSDSRMPFIKRYCIREIDETDVVVPFEWAMEHCGEKP